ncbi:MAG: FAD-dependent oxidoreductase [Rhodospirillaceae bacterium]|jgi:dimethylamine/trimethylamine dehydrogenase|nr:FAD-dependent oxidoreductase [Rhodospirillaceae bacterium]
MARDPKYDVLFEPIQIGPKTMKNRFYQVPHCNGAGSLRPGTQAAFRAMKAEGGWGAVCTEACSIDPEIDTTPNTLATLWDNGDVINMRHMCDSLHAFGCLAGVEMWYGGGESANLDTRDIPRSSAEWTSDYARSAYSHVCDEDDIHEIQQMYVEAGKRAVQAGFDIAYVMGSHTTIAMHFLSPLTNKRTDGYGGSLENRARFWLETLEMVKTAIGDECAVAVRLAVDQILGADGIQAHEEGIQFVELATNEGLVDLWDINICDFLEWGEDAGPSRFYKANHQAPFTKHIRAAAKAPVLNVGRFTNPDDMVDIINSGQVDIIGAARPSVADPFLPNKIDEGRVDDIRECIGCNICIARWERGAPLICTQNPVANEEYRRGWHPEKFEQAKDSGSVLVAGAGPAGLECARVLGLRGYDVHLCEADGEIGGHVRDVMRLPGLSEWGRVVSYRQTQLDKLKNVEIHTNSPMTADSVLTYGADKVVICTGFTWNADGMSHVTMAPIPGVDASTAQFATPDQVMAGKEIGDRVIVVDGDGYFTGVSLAELLADQGKQVSIVTHLPSVGQMTEYTLEAPNLHRMMHEKGIVQYTSTWLEEVVPDNLVKAKVFNLYRDGYERTTEPVAGELPRKAGTEFEILEADTIIVVTGRSANDGLFRELKERKGEWQAEGIEAVYAAGDCYAPRFMADAIFDGHRIAREFETKNPRRPLPMLRERMIWGHDITPSLGT